jgi:hypothetical protein
MILHLPIDILKLISSHLNLQGLVNLLRAHAELGRTLNIRAEKSVRLCASMLIKTRNVNDLVEHRITVRQNYHGKMNRQIAADEKSLFYTQIEDFGVVFATIMREGMIKPMAIYMDKYQHARIILECRYVYWQGRYKLHVFVTKELMDIFDLIDLYEGFDGIVCDPLHNIRDYEAICRIYGFANSRQGMQWYDMCRAEKFTNFVRAIHYDIFCNYIYFWPKKIEYVIIILLTV